MNEILYHVLEGDFPSVKSNVPAVRECPDLTRYLKMGEKFNTNYKIDVYKKRKKIVKKERVAV